MAARKISTKYVWKTNFDKIKIKHIEKETWKDEIEKRVIQLKLTCIQKRNQFFCNTNYVCEKTTTAKPAKKNTWINSNVFCSHSPSVHSLCILTRNKLSRFSTDFKQTREEKNTKCGSNIGAGHKFHSVCFQSFYLASDRQIYTQSIVLLYTRTDTNHKIHTFFYPISLFYIFTAFRQRSRRPAYNSF